MGGVVQVAPDLHRERQEGHPLALHDVPVLERCGVGSARSKKEAKEQAAALALRALAREPPRDL